MGNLFTQPSYVEAEFASRIVTARDESGNGEIMASLEKGDFSHLPDNLYANFQMGLHKQQDQPCLGFRQIDPKTKTAAPTYTWLSYKQIDAKIRAFASGIQSSELLQASGEDNLKFLGIFMKNRVEWVVSQLATFYSGGVVVPLYQTLGTEAIEHILNQTQMTTIVCTHHELEKIVDIKETCPHLLNVILCGEVDLDLKERAEKSKIKVFTFDDVSKKGQEHPCEPTPGKADDLCTIMYTSGTTGVPKGVLMNQKALLYGGEANNQKVIGFKNCVYLSYLPLPHSFETVAQTIILREGGCIGFYQGEPTKILDDLQALEPTLFITVPRLLNKIYDKIHAQLEDDTFKSRLVKRAISRKLYNASTYGIDSHWLYDRIIFQKLKQKLGFGRCVQMIVGGAPTSIDVLSFFRVAFLCYMTEGYGSTETCGASTCNDYTDFPNGTIGGCNVANQVKLVSVADMGYHVTDTLHTSGSGDNTHSVPCVGRGEICVRGPNVFAGYYKFPEGTAEVLDEEGWYHTGDIGIWTTGHRLKIIDRKKNIFKLSQGEYVAPEKVENILRLNPYVEQVFVYGDSFHSHLVAMAVVDLANLTKLAEQNEVFAEDIKDPVKLCKNVKLQQIVLNDLRQTSRQHKLAGFETVKDVRLLPHPFEEKLVTPTFKLKRHIAKQEYMHLIEEMYSESGDLVAGTANIMQG